MGSATFLALKLELCNLIVNVQRLSLLVHDRFTYLPEKNGHAHCVQDVAVEEFRKG
jgi:hypothetical protein